MAMFVAQFVAQFVAYKLIRGSNPIILKDQVNQKRENKIKRIIVAEK